jgi:hypothetical protein
MILDPEAPAIKSNQIKFSKNYGRRRTFVVLAHGLGFEAWRAAAKSSSVVSKYPGKLRWDVLVFDVLA